MNVLLSVFECNPLRGSDSFVGWSYAVNMAKYNTVFALTRTENQADIETYCRENQIDSSNLHFLYVDQAPLFTEKLYKVNRYLGFLGSYFVWQRAAYKRAKELCKTTKIDICHHVSIADFRCAGHLWRLNVPFIFGPVGGGQETPECLTDYVKGHEKGEFFRVFMNRVTTVFPSYRGALKKAAIIYSSNDETSCCIKKCIGEGDDAKRLVQLTELCIDQSYLEERRDIVKKENSVVHIIVSGRLIYRKGVRILLEAVSQICSKNEFILDIYGDGDQRKELERYTISHGLDDKVIFHGRIPFSEMQQAYRNADIYVLPSLRESTGTAVFEALGNKLPVVTFNQNGAKYVVQNDAGILVDLISKEQIVRDFAKAIERLIDNPKLRAEYGECGFRKLEQNYTWNKRVEQMAEVYTQICRGR